MLDFIQQAKDKIDQVKEVVDEVKDVEVMIKRKKASHFMFIYNMRLEF